MQLSPSLRRRSDDAGTGKKTVHEIGIELNFPAERYSFKELPNLQVIVDLMKVVISDILQCGCRNDIFGSLDLFVKVYRKLHGDFGIFYLLIVFRHLFPGICQGGIGDSEKFRMFPYTLDVARGCLLPIAVSLLNKVGQILGFSVVV